MNRTVKYVLPAGLFLLVCLVGLSPAQQGSTAAVPAKEQGKAGEAENESDIVDKNNWNKYVEETLNKLTKQLDVLKNQKAELRSEQKQLRDEIYKRCGMSPENVVPSLLNVEREIFTAQIDLESKVRGKEAIAKQIAEGAENVKKNMDNDPVLKNLKSLVIEKTEALQILEGQYKMGTAPYTDLSKAKAELTEAKIRLALREEELTKGNGDAGTGKLYLLIRENSLAVTQIEARLIALSGHCQRLRETRDLVDQYTDRTESEIPRINRQIDRMSDKILNVKESEMAQPDKENNSR
ncbi:MAG: hypothetical protein ABSA26_05700 [Thermoguttaceae bacterium]|jgi:predicted  nucleic acid-binding Zn-ribbon protein